METLPSKELLSDVMGFHCDNISMNETDIEYYEYVSHKDVVDIEDKEFKIINIYELMHLMKEWAMSYEYYIYSRCRIKNRGASVTAIATTVKRTLFSIPDLSHTDIETYNKGKTEPEAVIKACEWILKETQCKK